MNKLLSRTNLTSALVALITIKFIVVPLLDWQSDLVNELDAKSRRLTKLVVVVEAESLYEQQLAKLYEQISNANSFFYPDSAQTKLKIQMEIENVFDTHSVKIDGFNWILDDEKPVRALRASIRYSGQVDDIIKTFWALARLPQIVRQVAWRQRIDGVKAAFKQSGSGDLTLEFYASSERNELINTDTKPKGEIVRVVSK